jgi:hypothetical protein
VAEPNPGERQVNETFGLFEHDGRVYWSGPNFPDHQPEDEQPLPLDKYPVTTQLLCADHREGYGWGRHRVEAHAEVLDDFLYDVRASSETQAVTVKVANEADLLYLLRCFEVPEKRVSPL